MKKVILAIDPGRIKCGIAVVDHQLNLLEGHVVLREQLIDDLKTFVSKYNIQDIAVGSGTNSEKIIREISDELVELRITIVPEKDTTMLARKRYFEFFPPRGLLRYIPISLRIPPCPYDEFAAMVIAERFFSKFEEQKRNL